MQEEVKQAIAEKGVTLVKPGHVVYLDSGTTSFALAQALVKKKINDVTVIVSSIPLMLELFNAKNMRLIVLPGELHLDTGSIYGTLF